jgi:hypothetical protein
MRKLFTFSLSLFPFFLSVVLLNLVFLPGCGSNNKTTTTVEPIAAPVTKNSVMRQILPQLFTPEESEKERYIRLRAEHTVFIIQGGSGDKWLRDRNISASQWRDFSDRYWLDPEVRTAVSSKVSRLRNSIYAPLR